MKRWLLRIVCALSLVAGLACAGIWYVRGSLLYNAEGRYFSPGTGTVIHEHSVAAFGLIALLFLVLALATGLLSRKR